MRMCIIVLLMVAVGFTGKVRTQSSPKIPVLGVGTESCGRWTATKPAFDARNVAGGAIDHISMLSWVQGFLSGIDMAGAVTPPNTAASQLFQIRQPDTSALVLAVDQYCQEHPLELLWGAAVHVMGELNSAPSSGPPPAP
jgi:hypothetical protein